jgi:hypothetical protein
MRVGIPTAARSATAAETVTVTSTAEIPGEREIQKGSMNTLAALPVFPIPAHLGMRPLN